MTCDEYLVERVSNGLIRVISAPFGRQLLSRRKLRKEARCATCRIVLEKGAIAWGEVTSCAKNRHHRLCDNCVLAGEAATQLSKT